MKRFAFGLILAALALPALAAEEAAGFAPLFNGTDTAGWHARNDKGHNAWKVEEGVLRNDLQKGEHGTDLVSDQKYWNFTVRYDYLVPEGSNSGFYLRGRHEIQILGQKDREPKKGGDGAIYTIKEPSTFASKTPGEWNSVEATIIGNKITVTLNGQKIHDAVECNTATGSELDRNVTEPGSLFLQGDHGAVSFRSISIKELAKE